MNHFLKKKVVSHIYGALFIQVHQQTSKSVIEHKKVPVSTVNLEGNEEEDKNITKNEQKDLIDNNNENIPFITEKENKPEDIVDTILFLASEEAGFMTGEIITVDAGYSLMKLTMEKKLHKTKYI